MPGRTKPYLFVVKVPAVVGLTKRDAQTYVRDAVRCHAGGGHPDDPLFHKARQIAVKTCLYDIEQDSLRSLRGKLKKYFDTHAVDSGVFNAIMTLVDDHMDGSA